MRKRWVRRAALTVALAAAFSFLLGCGVKAVQAPVVGGLTTEQFARGVREELATFLRASQKNHPECSGEQPGAKLGICPSIHKAIDVSNGMGRAINVYCSGLPAPGNEPYGVDTNGDGRGGPCSPVLGAKPQLNIILAQALNLLANPEVAKLVEGANP